MTAPPAGWPAKLPIFGVAVSATTYDELAEAIVRAARERRPACVTALAVHGLMTAASDAGFRRMLDSFDALAPDGLPVQLALNVFHEAGVPRRVRGVDLTLHVCRRAARDGVKIYLLGSRPDVVQAFRTALVGRFNGLEIVGCEPGIYRHLTEPEDAALVTRINQSGAGLLLLGLGCPHQEMFAYAHQGRIAPVQFCVGSAFDVISGAKLNAPQWIQRSGFEWLFRLVQEPRRLWKRYLITNTQFIVRFTSEVVRQRVVRRSRIRRYGE